MDYGYEAAATAAAASAAVRAGGGGGSSPQPLQSGSPSGGGAFASHVAGAGGGEARQLGEGEAPRAPAHLPPLSALELVAGSPLRLPGGEVGLVVAVDAPAEGVADEAGAGRGWCGARCERRLFTAACRVSRRRRGTARRSRCSQSAR